MKKVTSPIRVAKGLSSGLSRRVARRQSISTSNTITGSKDTASSKPTSTARAAQELSSRHRKQALPNQGTQSWKDTSFPKDHESSEGTSKLKSAGQAAFLVTVLLIPAAVAILVFENVNSTFSAPVDGNARKGRTNRIQYSKRSGTSPRDVGVKEEGGALGSEIAVVNSELPVPEELYTGKLPLVFVIDYGIDVSHEEFVPGQILELYRPQEGMPPKLRVSTHTIPHEYKERGEPGREMWSWGIHGTMVASAIAGQLCGVAPGAHLVDVRYPLVPNEDDPGSFQEIVGSLEKSLFDIKQFLEANEDCHAIINICIGDIDECNFDFDTYKCNCGPDWKYPCKVTKDSEADPLLWKIHKLGALIIAAAGNDCTPSEAAWPNHNSFILSVGALDESGDEHEMSNYGAHVTLYAQAFGVPAAVRAPDQIDHISGATSLTAPYVTGHAYKLMLKNLGADCFKCAELRPGALKALLLREFDVRQLGHRQRPPLREKPKKEEQKKGKEKENVDEKKGIDEKKDEHEHTDDGSDKPESSESGESDDENDDGKKSSQKETKECVGGESSSDSEDNDGGEKWKSARWTAMNWKASNKNPSVFMLKPGQTHVVKSQPGASTSEDSKSKNSQADKSKSEKSKADESKPEKSKADEAKSETSKADESDSTKSETDESKTKESQSQASNSSGSRTEKANSEKPKTGEKSKSGSSKSGRGKR